MSEYSTPISILKKPTQQTIPQTVPQTIPQTIPQQTIPQQKVQKSIKQPVVLDSSPGLIPPPIVQSNTPQQPTNLMPGMIPQPPPTTSTDTNIQPKNNVGGFLYKLSTTDAFNNSNNIIIPLLASIFYFFAAKNYGNHIFNNIFKINPSKFDGVYINTFILFIGLYFLQIKNNL